MRNLATLTLIAARRSLSRLQQRS